jgi:mitochondrial fission protein ELM1
VGAPRIWLLLAEKAGDNAQVEALAAALPWPVEVRRIEIRPRWRVAKPRVRPTLDHVDLDASDPLEPPWPDLLITMGRRTSSVALWIQQRSGDHTKIVLIGKPSGSADRMALLVGSAELLLPPLPQVLKIRLPLLRMDPERVAKAAELWRPRFESLPRPMIAFLIGGPTRPYVYDETVTRRLLALARQVLDQGGTPYLTTSRRTPEALAEALERDLPEGAILHRWRAEAPPEENPFLALLGLSDGCIVTADSASMIVEVASLGRRLAILDLPVGGGWGRLELARRRLLRALFEPPRGGLLDGLRCGLARTAFRSRLVWASRDFRVLHEWLVDEGFAVWAGEELVTPPGPLPDDRERVARRVGALLPDDRRAVAKPEAAASE